MKAALVWRRAGFFLLVLFFFANVFPLFPTDNSSDRFLRIVGDHNYPPYEFLNKKGKPDGFNIDIVRAVAAVMRLRFKIKLLPWKKVVKELVAGKADMVTGMYYSKKRARTFSFSVPFVTVTHGIFVRKGSSVQRLGDMKNKQVLVQDGDIMHDYLRENRIAGRVIAVQDQEDALRLLASGRYDCALLSRLQGMYLVTKYNIEGIVSVGPPIKPRKYCFSVRKGNDLLLTKLNEGLKIIHNNGTYQRLFQKWFAPAVAVSKKAKRIIKYLLVGLTAIFCLIVVLFFVSRSLKRQVTRKTSELRESKERLKLAIDGASDGLWDFTIEENVKQCYYSPRWFTMLGYMPNELSSTLDTWERLLHPDDREGAVGRYHYFLEHHDRDYISEFRLRTKDGTWKWIVSRGRAVAWDKNGNVIRMAGTHSDITKRKQAEIELARLKNLFKNIINSMPSALICLDASGRITHWNKDAEKMTGISGKRAEGCLLVDMFPWLAKKLSDIKDVFILHSVRKMDKLRFDSKDGIRLVAITVYPLEGDTEEGVVVRIDDVTERLRIEEVVQQSEKMLSLGGLAAGMAHEINNPLAGIVQNMQIIEKRLAKDQKKNITVAEELGIDLEALEQYLKKREITQMIEYVLESGSRAANIVMNMLNFSRKSKPVFSLCAVGEVLDKAVAIAESDYDLKKMYDFKRLRIVRDYAANLPFVSCDDSMLQQVFLNILKNGAQAMAAKDPGGHASCFTFTLKNEGAMVRVEIADNGPGMSQDVRARIFEPFFTTKEIGVGTGLGLSVAYFIITETHNGELLVESAPGKGSTFIVLLPSAGH